MVYISLGFPSLIGSSKTLPFTFERALFRLFPSLIGSSKTIHFSQYPPGLRLVSIPHRKFKNRNGSTKELTGTTVSIPHRKFKNRSASDAILLPFLVSIPHRKFKNLQAFFTPKTYKTFPSLIGSSKTRPTTFSWKSGRRRVSIPHRKFKNQAGQMMAQWRTALFPSLIGSSKTYFLRIRYCWVSGFPSLIGSSKTRRLWAQDRG